MKRYFLYALIISLAASCKTQNLLHITKDEYKEMEVLVDSTFLYDPNYEYIIQTDDKVSISVWGQDELSIGSVYGIYNSNEVYGKWLLVDIDGHIETPRIGTMCVAGYSVAELKEVLKAQYSNWIVNPIVDVKVLNKEITILGEVKQPGVLQIDKDNNTLFEIVARSGGFEFYANLQYVKVLRQEGEHVRMANLDLTYNGEYLNQNIQLRPGDVVIIPSKGYKEFDKRISTIIPFTSTITAAAVMMGAF